MKKRIVFALVALTDAACALWAAPIPTVYWDGDFDTAQKTGLDGLTYTFDPNGNEVSGGKLQVAANPGLVTWPTGDEVSLTVLVKYSSLSAPTAESTLLSFRTTDVDDVGLRALASGDVKLGGYSTKNGSSTYGSLTAASPSGYVHLAHKGTSGTVFMSGLSVDGMTVVMNASLKSSGSMVGVALGGPNASAAYPVWEGVVIEAVAIFRDSYLSSLSAISGFRFPSETVAYEATVSGDVADLQKDATIEWRGATLPEGGSADAMVTWNMVAPATISPDTTTKINTLSLTGSGDAVFSGGKPFSPLQVLDLSDYRGAVDVWPNKTIPKESAYRVGSAATAVLHVDSSTVTASGQILGEGKLVKAGAGTLTLSGGNCMTGEIGVREGILKIGANGSVGPNAFVSDTGMLDLNGKTGVTNLRLSGAGDGVKTSAALRVLAKGAGRIRSLVLDGDATVTNTVELSFGSDDSTVAAAKLNGHTLVKQGLGALNIRSLATDAGTIRVDGGTLTVSGAGNFGERTSLALAAGVKATLSADDSANVTVGTVSNDGEISGASRIVAAKSACGSGTFDKLTLASGAAFVPTDASSPLTVTGVLAFTSGKVVLDVTALATDEAAAAGVAIPALKTSREIADSDIMAFVHDSSNVWTVARETVGSMHVLSIVPTAATVHREWIGGSGAWSKSSYDGAAGYSDDVRQNAFFTDAADGSADPLVVTVVDGPRTVTCLTFSNDVRSVKLTGGAVEAYTVAKTGGAAVTIGSPLTLTGGIVIGKGTLVIDVPAGETTSVAGPISGEGDLVKTGKGTLLVTGDSGEWMGTLTVSDGVARCGGECSFGPSEICVVGGTLDLNGVRLCNALAISGDGFDGNGAIVNTGSSLLTTEGLASLRLLGNASIGGSAGEYCWKEKEIDLCGYTLTKTGSVRLPLYSNSIVGNGKVVVAEGTLEAVQGTNDLSDAALAIQANASLVVRGDLMKVRDFTCNAKGSVSGSAALEVHGVLDAEDTTFTVPMLSFADGATLKGGGLTVSTSLTFGEQLKVQNLSIGSAAMRYLAEDPSGYENVVIRIIGDLSRFYSFSYDADEKALVIDDKPLPPTFELTDTKVVYGVDMTNAVVKFTIADYHAGSGYSGALQALLTVRDASGRVVAERGLDVTGDGEYAFDAVALLNGRGSGYSYDISALIRETELSTTERLTGSGASEYVVRLHSGWFSEDANTFDNPQTGKWTYHAGTAYVEDDLIVHGLSGSNLVFTPKVPSAQEVARVKSTILVEDGNDMPKISDLPANAHAAFALAAEGSGLVYVALTPALAEPVRLYSTGPEPNPVAGTRCVICADFNYAQGTVTFTENGNALTNAEGAAFFPISSVGCAAKSLAGVTFTGYGRLAELSGDQLNTNLAKDAATGVEYATVDDAVAALPKGGEIEMLWDALWHPTVADLGHSYTFTGDHKVVLDCGTTNELARTGYAVVENPDGSYSVSVIEYSITFTANGGSGEDQRQIYSVTNLVFSLLKNQFTSNAMDFACWNAAADGSARTNYSDCATIDMSEYGFTNMTLYAQWKVATRTITVATPDQFVYLEQVTTNSPYGSPAVHDGVKFYSSSGPGAEKSASFGVESGSYVTLVFSTDIENRLSSDRLNYSQIKHDLSIGHGDLPTLQVNLGSRALSEYELWAHSKGIALSEFSASPYAMASYDLDTASLLDERTEIRLENFTVLPDGCSFRVLVNGVALSDRSAIASMILVSDDLNVWKEPGEGDVSVDGETVSVRTSGSGTFVKIVVPQD